jgi:hypothetical protein
MNTTDKKMYLIPETEALSLESIHSLMTSPGGGGSGDPGDPNNEEFTTAPKRNVF